MILSKKQITLKDIADYAEWADAQAGLCLCCSQTAEDRFSRFEAHMKVVRLNF